MSTQYTGKSQTSRLKPLAVLIPLLIAGNAAAVETGKVVGGSATINTSGATTTINQSTDRAIINWNNFDIGASERVQINQPSTTSAILNRVTSASATQIDGALNANGRVFVVNPNGVVVGKSGSINANGVVLSTLDVSDSFFMGSPETLLFRKVNGAANAAVVNDGTINAQTGGVSLFGSQVINGATGSISAKGDDHINANGGTLTAVNLVASNTVNVYQPNRNGQAAVYSGTDLASTVANGLVANDGTIKAEAGEVQLYSRSGISALGETLRNTGSITATTADYTMELFPGQQDSYPVGGTIGLFNSSEVARTHIGGSIDGYRVTAVSRNPTVLDGSIDATNSIDVSANNYSFPAQLTVTENARLNSSYVNLIGDHVTVDGQVTATMAANVEGRKQADVREGALNAPHWSIRSGNKGISGTGSNGSTVPVYGSDGYDQYGYDRNGYDRDGFNRQGFSAEGYDRYGFNAQGLDKDGFDRSGFNAAGYDRYGFNRQGFNAEGYDRYGFNVQGFDKDGFNRQGFDIAGFDRSGFNAAGFDKDGYDRQGYDLAGLDRNGVARPGTGNPGGGDTAPYNPPYGPVTYDAEGYDLYGFDRQGFDRAGYNIAGYDRHGVPVQPAPVTKAPYKQVIGADGYDQYGFNSSSYDRDGFNWSGFNVQGLSRDGFNVKGYNRDGYDRQGYNAFGYDKYGYDRLGFDASGNFRPKSLTLSYATPPVRRVAVVMKTTSIA